MATETLPKLSCEELESLLDAWRMPAAVLGLDYRILAANRSYRESFGAEVVGRHCYEVSHRYVAPCDQCGEECPVVHCRETRQPSRGLHVHYTQRGAEHEEVSVDPVYNRRGWLVGFLETLRRVEAASARPEADRMVGRSPAFNRMLELVHRVAPTDTAVLLLGETGTGKEIVARTLHNLSQRSKGGFVPLDCSGLTETLFESELFGHEKGAFTGAVFRKKGLVEAAEGGTLLLDEVGDIPPPLQVKLLRLLETGTYRRVGSPEQRRASFRLICATHRDLEALDIGKDTMYHSFDMFHPDLAAAGHMLNMPETASPELAALYGVAVGDFLPLIPNDLAVARAGGDLSSAVPNQYDTSISRRGSFALQPGSKIAEAAATGSAGGMTSAVLLYKAGADRQGGPADVFMRRIVIPYGFNPATDNPYAVENLVCSQYDTSLTDVSGPTYPRTSYPDGLCVRGAVNLSSATPLTFEPLDNELPEHGITDRVLTWNQSPLNLTDEDWTNKYDVAKGHRGFLDGDFIMVMYGYSPNWLATSKGHEPYNLYIRRSFDGGLTWTTTPASLGGDGTTYDQILGVGDRAWTETRVLGPGEFEPARNVSQLTSSKDTILDPRYSPTNIGTQTDIFRILLPDGTYQVLDESHPLYDKRDPSKFFTVFETGDATVVLTAGEADPWDLYASRATNWGDDWETLDVFAQGRGEWQERWDWIENKDETMAGESSIAASPDGQFAWIVWNQWVEDEADHVSDADPMFRRLWWDDSVTLFADAGTYEAAAGDLVTLTGTAVYDGDLETLVYTWDLDSDGEFETSGRIAELRATGAMQGAALRVCNGTGRCDVDQGWINAKVHTPRVWNVRTAEGSAPAGGTVDLTARFTDPGTGDSHDAVIDWGDGTIKPATTTESPDGKGAALVVGSHTYEASGLYTVKVTVTDDDGHSGWDFLRYAVVYDQSAGNVDAPDLTFTDPVGGGRSKLDFHAKYKKTATIPEGRIKIEVGGLRFEGSALDWLVVTPEGAIFLRGQGAVNGEGGYDVLVSAAAKTGHIRMKIWKRNGLNQTVVYDSQPGAADDALPATPVDKGRIKIERD